MHETLSDSELVRSFQRGDDSAFELLVQRHQHRIFRLAAAGLARPEQAADAAQEVFFRAYKGLKRFRFTAEPFTWLYRTMKNVCRELNRKNRDADHDVESLADYKPIERVLETRQRVRQVKNLLGELSPRQQEVMMLRVFEELSIEETAKAMNCRKGTVKSLLNGALTRLRALDEAQQHRKAW